MNASRLTAASALLVAAGAAAAPAPRPAPAPSQTAVDLNLILAVDASGSVDDDRFELQKQGYAKAFLNQRVLNAIRAGNEQQIAVTMLQWTGPTLHVVMVPWMIIRDQRTAQAFAAAIGKFTDQPESMEHLDAIRRLPAWTPPEKPEGGQTSDSLKVLS